MKLIFKSDISLNEYENRLTHKSSLVQEFVDAMKDMRVGEYFEYVGNYSKMELIRKAFKVKGWKCTCRTERVSPDKFDKRGLRIFKIRAWRIK